MKDNSEEFIVILNNQALQICCNSLESGEKRNQMYLCGREGYQNNEENKIADLLVEKEAKVKVKVV